ncbi:acyl-CoA dehydrogenase [Clostridium botulinum]|nr:acyl-CoA dehydrogenase [Clostridium botulinum]EKS4396598.1 acyl-CoA dehydrogenase [Clostridium botulinum]
MIGISLKVSRLVDGMQTQKNLVEEALILGILASVALTVILFVQLGYKPFFNDQRHLIIDN